MGKTVLGKEEKGVQLVTVMGENKSHSFNASLAVLA